MKFAERFWDVLTESVEKLNIPWHLAIIYQDTQVFSAADTVFAQEHRNLARKGGRNSQLILWLMDRGAWLERTEHHKLLGMKELYSPDPTAIDIFLKKKPISPDERSRQGKLRDRIMLLRDRYIAHRINCTLGEPKIGLLFLGSSHRTFLHYLSPDIEVRNILAREDYKRFLLFLHERKS